MSLFYTISLCILFANIGVALYSLARDKSEGSRMLFILLMGTSGLCVILIFYAFYGHRAYLDIALLFALLAAIAGIVFSRRAWVKTDD